MLVTAIQPVGARGLGTVQATVTRAPTATEQPVYGEVSAERTATPGTPQPVYFLREGMVLDMRPHDLRLKHAVERYREDGETRRRPRR
jgi:hypothetical protein